MNDVQKEIEHFLSEMNSQYQTDATTFTHDFIYKHLIQYGVYVNEAKVKTTQWYPIWEANLGKLKNLNVYLPKKKQEFFVLRNLNMNEETSIENYIKVYIPLHRSHFNQCVQLLFTYLSEKNIRHDSKIRNQIANDAVVLRLTKLSDVDLVLTFIQNEPLFATALLKPNPFAMKKSGVAITKDGHLSYNSIVSYYIENYIKEEKEQVSISRFYQYVRKIYQMAFIDGYHLSILMHTHQIDYIFNNDEEYYQKVHDDCYITELLMSVLSGKDDVDTFFKPFYVKNKEKPNIQLLQMKCLKQEQEYHDTMYHLNQALEINLQEKGLNNTINAFQMYVGHGNTNGFTRKSGARSMMSQKVSRIVLSYILRDLTPEDYVRMEAYNCGYIKSEVSMDAVDEFITTLIDALVLTRTKYLENLEERDKKKRIMAMIDAISEGNFENISNTLQTRKKLISCSKKIRLELLDKMLYQFVLENNIEAEDEEEAKEQFVQLVSTMVFE